MDEAREITMAFSQLTGQLSKRVRFKYFMPQELQEIQQNESGENDKLSVD